MVTALASGTASWLANMPRLSTRTLATPLAARAFGEEAIGRPSDPQRAVAVAIGRAGTGNDQDCRPRLPLRHQQGAFERTERARRLDRAGPRRGGGDGGGSGDG